MNNKNWRILQIASTIIYRYFGDVSVESSNDRSCCDLIVRFRGESSLKFGVVVKSSYFKQSVEYRELIETMKSETSMWEKEMMPIILISVNESQESASVGFLMGWRFGQPYVYQDFEMRQLTQENVKVCLDIIKSMDQTIRVLSLGNAYIAKQIKIKQPIETGYSNAELLYLRRLSPEYSMKSKKIVTEKEKFERLLKGIPPEEYPHDELDDCITSAVAEKFDDITVINRMIVTSNELQDLLSFYDREKKYFRSTSLTISTNYTNMHLQLDLDLIVHKVDKEPSTFEDVSFSRFLNDDEIEKYLKIKKISDSLQIISNLMDK